MNDQRLPSPGVIERLERAEQLKLNGEYEQALVILEELLVEDPENVSALEEVADNELNLQHLERAQRASSQAVELDPQSYTGHYILGFLHSQREDWSAALRHLQTANKLKPNNAEILRCLGWALFKNNQCAQGIVTLERALNIEPENPLALCDLGVAYLHARNITKAKTLFQRTLDLDPGNARAQECAQAVRRLERMIQNDQAEMRESS